MAKYSRFFLGLLVYVGVFYLHSTIVDSEFGKTLWFIAFVVTFVIFGAVTGSEKDD